MTTRLLVMVAGCLTLGSCIFSEAAYRTRSVPPDKPDTGGQGVAEETPPSAGDPGAGDPSSAEPLSEPSYLPRPTLQRQLGGGVVALARDWSTRTALPDRTTLLRVTLPVGSGTGETGLAELTAAAVLDSTPNGEESVSLRDRIEQLGGEALFRIGSHTSSFAVSVPREQWRPALDAMVAAISTPPEPGEEIERIRHQLVRKLRRAYATENLENAARVVTRASGVPPQKYVAGIEDRSQNELGDFYREHYQPLGCVLTLWVPGIPAETVLDSAKSAVVPWVGDPAPEVTAPPIDPVAIKGGIYWATAKSDHCSFALVFPLPASASPKTLEAFALIEALTLDGVGGRLEKAMSPYPVSLRSGTYWDGGARHFVLVGTAPPSLVLTVWNAQQKARKSLASKPPNPTELRTAAERLRLRLLIDHSDPIQWVESMTSLGLQSIEPPDLADLLKQLKEPSKLDLEQAAADFAGESPALVIVGPAPDEETEQEIERLPVAFFKPTEQEIPVEVNEQAIAADEYMAEAVRAVGGGDQLILLSGWAAKGTRRGPSGLAVEETAWYRVPDRFRRVRRVLATTIETVITPEKSFERSGDESVDLDEDEINTLRLRLERHPLMLLSNFAQRKNRFRLISVRTVGEREMIVLQLLDSPYDNLRIMIDGESGLVRTVERHEWRAERKARVRISEEYSDYRSIGRMRFPFHRKTTIGGSEDGGSTVWADVQLENPADKFLEPGGPTSLVADK